MQKVFILTLLWALSGLVEISAHGDVHELINEYTQKIANDPKDASLYEMRGFLFYKDEDYKSALKDYKKATSLDSDLKGINFKIGLVYKSMENYKKAIKEFDRMLEQDSLHVLSIRNRAECYLSLEKYDEAIVDFRSVIDMSQDLISQNYVDLADTYLKVGNSEEAIATLKEGIQTKGKLVVLEQELIDLYVEVGDFQNAFHEIDIVMESMTRKESWLSLKGDIAIKANLSEEAKKYYTDSQNAIAILPSHIQGTDFIKNLRTHNTSQLESL